MTVHNVCSSTPELTHCDASNSLSSTALLCLRTTVDRSLYHLCGKNFVKEVGKGAWGKCYDSEGKMGQQDS